MRLENLDIDEKRLWEVKASVATNINPNLLVSEPREPINRIFAVIVKNSSVTNHQKKGTKAVWKK